MPKERAVVTTREATIVGLLLDLELPGEREALRRAANDRRLQGAIQPTGDRRSDLTAILSSSTYEARVQALRDADQKMAMDHANRPVSHISSTLR